MCGIFGLWHRNGDRIDGDRVWTATSTLRHRGPDDEGYLLVDSRAGRAQPCRGPETVHALQFPRLEELHDAAFDLALGFRRLAILDLSPAGHQPMSSRDGRVWTVFNGEIYNFRDLRSELTERGHEFHSGTDTEVVLASYQEWGLECLQRFNGMWALALWDFNDRSLLLSRDRFGVKPLHFTDRDGCFAFASEIKALVGAHGIPFVPDEEEVYRYLMYGTLPSPTGGQTFFEGVQSLPASHWMKVTAGGSETGTYWSLPSAVSSSVVSSQEAVAEFARLFQDSVRLHLSSDVPVGTCLSGGLDSSSIVTVINRLIAADPDATTQLGDRQKTFSAVYESSERYNEKPFIDLVLKSTQADRNFTYPTYEWLEADLERLVWHQDQPFQGTSMFAQWCVMSLVRERGVTVLLDGQGSDELLAGYRPYYAYLSDFVRRGQFRRLISEAFAARERTGALVVRLLIGAVSYWVISTVRPHLPSMWTQWVRKLRARPGATTRVLRPQFRRDHRAALPPPIPHAGNGFLDSIMREALTETSLPYLLHYEDRSSMAFGVEARVPFLDYRLVEFVFKHGFPYRINHGWTKWILREAMRDIVPSAIAWRRDKVGFETPEATWIRQWLDAHPDFFGHDALLSRYVDLDAVNREVDSWKARGGNIADARRIWRLVNLELWLKVWRERGVNVDPVELAHAG